MHSVDEKGKAFEEQLRALFNMCGRDRSGDATGEHPSGYALDD